MLISENIAVVVSEDTRDTDAGSYRAEVEVYQGVKNAIQYNQNESMFAVKIKNTTGGANGLANYP